VAVASAWLLPDEPLNTRWLTEDERKLAHSRIAADTVRLKANTSTWIGLKEALKDPRIWVLIPMYHFHMVLLPLITPITTTERKVLTFNTPGCFELQELFPHNR
jgi:hypothetical protein